MQGKASIWANLEAARGRIGKELIAGITVGVIALPLALAFGVSAFAPLGPAYGALGAVAGLTGAAFTGFLASLFGGCAPQVTGPTGPMAVVARSTLATLLASPLIMVLPEQERVAAVLALFAVSVVLGGLIQWVLAWSRLGALVRVIPYPVVAGFMNGVSVLILLGQIRPFLGWQGQTPWNQLWTFSWPLENIVGLLASLGTVAIILLLPRLTKKIPASFVGLLGGTGLYYLLSTFFYPQGLNLAQNSNLVGAIPSSIPLPTMILNADLWIRWLSNPNILGLLAQQAIVLGLLGTIDTLLTSVIADLRTSTRHNSSRELFGQGLGNIVSGVFGGLPGAGATVRTLVNIDNGGRSGLSGAFHGVILLAILIALGPLAQGIPLPVLGAILMVMAVRMIDVWSFELLRKKSARGDSIVLWLVTAITVAVDLIVAVGVGLVVAAFLYVRKQTILGAQVQIVDMTHTRSKVLRGPSAEASIAAGAGDVCYATLKGSLFFGSADDHMARLEEQATGAKYFVLDLSDLGNLDLTGAKMLIDLASRLKSKGSKVFWGGLDPQSKNYAFLSELGLAEVLSDSEVFSSVDLALECAEECIIGASPDYKASLTVPELDFWKGMSPDEVENLQRLISTKVLAPGEVLFSQGDPSNDIYFVLSGQIEVRASKPGERVVAYGPGLHLGLLAWIEERPKTYTALAAKASTLAVLPFQALRDLLDKNPALAYHLLKGWSAKLVQRIRRLETIANN